MKQTQMHNIIHQRTEVCLANTIGYSVSHSDKVYPCVQEVWNSKPRTDNLDMGFHFVRIEANLQQVIASEDCRVGTRGHEMSTQTTGSSPFTANEATFKVIQGGFAYPKTFLQLVYIRYPIH